MSLARQSVNSLPWFIANDMPGIGEEFVLLPEEGRHATGSKRMGTGDRFCLFDGNGTLGLGEIRSIAAKRTIARCEEVWFVPAPSQHLVLAAALPKGDRLNVMLSMGAQLGMSEFIALQCERGVAAPGRNFQRRAARVLVEACKQSRRARVPSIASPRRLFELAAESAGELLVADRSGAPIAELADQLHDTDDRIIAAIGPEGGFTDAELGAARQAGATICSLGEATLRIETAAAAVLAWLAIIRMDR